MTAPGGRAMARRLRALAVAAAATLLCGTTLAAEPRRAPPHPPSTAPGFGDLVERLMPTVVNVASIQIPTPAEGAREPPPLPPDVVLDELFRDLLERQRRNRAPTGRNAR